MQRITNVLGAAAIFGLGLAAGTIANATAAQPAIEQQCGSASASQVRTTLYFGSARPKGSVSELEWQIFLRDEVTVRFPEGLTVWDAHGQWRGSSGSVEHERAKVLLLVHPDTPAARRSVTAVIDRYRKAFDQQSVLWETSRVCIAS
jgi:hypothetical protein